jgi:dCMP deaminase
MSQIKKIFRDFFEKHGDKFKKFGTEVEDELLNALKKDLKVKRLEYCKALHAEENAIIQGAKIGGMGIRGGTMYVTTFPCELCAKKIHQAGINEIVYTEPYPGTISKDIYLEDGVSKVISRQFEGVKPFGYFQLFKPFHDQKEWQELSKRRLVE